MWMLRVAELRFASIYRFIFVPIAACLIQFHLKLLKKKINQNFRFL